MNSVKNNAKILIVDDNPKNLQLLGAVLRTKKYQLVVAQNGIQALDSINTVKPDLVLLDIMMPEMDGYETCMRIKDIPDLRKIPIIFLTAKTEKEDIVKGFELGAVDYITKPFNSKELLARVETHLKLKFTKEIILKQKNELMELVQILCHDLSNPLGAILSSLELAQDDSNYFTQNKHLMLSYAKRQYDIIGLVRHLRSIEEEKKTLNLSAVNIREALDESIETLNYQLLEKNIQPVIMINKDIQVIAEKTSLVNSVFNNLLTNAIKFSYPGSKIIIEARNKEPNTEITITDFGIGIPNDLQEKLFEIDRRTTRFGTNGEKGTGFGMPLVKKFVTIYGGIIDIWSKEESRHPEEHGTKIRLTLIRPSNHLNALPEKPNPNYSTNSGL